VTRRTIAAPPVVEAPGKLGDILADLRRSETETARLYRARAAELRRLHRIGWTWAELGETLGVSRQRAQQMSEQHY
jgi:hypothetical protein